MQAALCAVAAGNAATLQELRISAPAAAHPQWRLVQDFEALLRAAPQLRVLEADVFCGDATVAHHVLRSEPPFEPLRVRQLFVNAHAATADDVLALAADLDAHSSLTRGVWLHTAPLNDAAALDAVVDAALACRLTSVRLDSCRLSPASAPALARLLRGDTLTELVIHGYHQLLDAPAAALLADALRANTSLTALTLQSIDLWRDAAAAAELLAALTAHPRLRLLDLSSNDPHHGGLQAGAALAALLLANAPALHTLCIRNCRLGDEGMGPVVEALRHNTHLTTLNCDWNNWSEEFARERLLPAVRANAALHELSAAGGDAGAVAAREAEALVAARAQPE
jgi:hypothetical protein